MTPGTSNDGRFPDDSPVWVWYPPEGDKQSGSPPREQWAWLPGSILSQCGPSEWLVVVEVRELATREDGSTPAKNTPSRKLYYPTCYRDQREIRPRTGDRP
jgi:hypothetical protein